MAFFSGGGMGWDWLAAAAPGYHGETAVAGAQVVQIRAVSPSEASPSRNIRVITGHCHVGRQQGARNQTRACPPESFNQQRHQGLGEERVCSR